MSAAARLPEIRMIPLDRIEVLNPRERNQEAFDLIKANILALGLKKPITVTPRPGPDGAEMYLLLCGEGRLRALRELGETRIPALIATVDDEDGFIISLTENIARRRYRPLELLEGIMQLRDRKFSLLAIAEKTGLSDQYVADILMLAGQGEKRLLAAVEQGTIPISAALAIAGAGENDKAMQAALQDAYESGELRGRQLLGARRLIQRRRGPGPAQARNAPQKQSGITSSSVVRTFHLEVARQRQVVRKAALSQQRLAFILGALRLLFADENFVTLLRAEKMETLPRYLAERMAGGAS